MTTIRRFAIISAVLTSTLISTNCWAQFIIESLDGPPTAKEIKSVDDFFKANPPVPSGTNQGNNFAYGSAAGAVTQMRTMYTLTGDTFYLDKAIQFADFFLANRNDPTTGRIIWTGKREPCWPNKDVTAPDAAYCGAENGLVINQIVSVAKIIAQDPSLWNRAVGIGDVNGFGATYLQRAQTYIREGNRTLDDFLLPHWLQPNNRLVIPTDPGFAALGASYTKDQGHALPWNQQSMIVSALSTISECDALLGTDATRVANNDTVVKAAIDWYVGELQTNQYTANGFTVYKWGYSPGDLKHIENLAHASSDINMLNMAFQRGTFGVTESSMVAMADTFLQVIAKPDGTFADFVDGKGTRTSVSTSWVNYEDFRTGIYKTIITPTVQANAATNAGTALGILSIKAHLNRFSLTAGPANRTVTAGSNASYTATTTATSTFSGAVNLAADGLPSGASCSFNPASITGGSGFATLNCTTSSSTLAGTYTITITGTAGSLSHSATVSLTVNTTSACPTATANATWNNFAFPSQSGTFMAAFDATPSVSGQSSAVGLSKGAQTAYAGFANIVAFATTGIIQARNGGAYVDSAVHYTGGTSYHFRLVINLSTHTYSVFVTPAGGSEQMVGLNFAFRTGQNMVTSLDHWGALVNTRPGGTLKVCNFTVQ